jgi:hypothetical protein
MYAACETYTDFVHRHSRLNFETEWSETNANRHVQMVEAMLTDGM